ncbi:MAG: DHH family phosphoesterase, partial [Clostridia bacterium]|nr:DHH family phosphoesterase [Clostridia bacterium]
MQAVIDKINAAKSVAIITHVNEDPDTIGSCFAFQKMLRKMGKEAVIYVSGKIEDRLSFMGSDYVTYRSGIQHNHDLCACLDCGDLGRIGERKTLFDEIGNSINIDHHMTNTCFADANLVDGKASAAAEIVTLLFREMGLELD